MKVNTFFGIRGMRCRHADNRFSPTSDKEFPVKNQLWRADTLLESAKTRWNERTIRVNFLGFTPKTSRCMEIIIMQSLSSRSKVKIECTFFLYYFHWRASSSLNAVFLLIIMWLDFSGLAMSDVKISFSTVINVEVQLMRPESPRKSMSHRLRRFSQ